MEEFDEIKKLDKLILELNQVIKEIKTFNYSSNKDEEMGNILELRRKHLIKKYYSAYEDFNIIPMLH